MHSSQSRWAQSIYGTTASLAALKPPRQSAKLLPSVSPGTNKIQTCFTCSGRRRRPLPNTPPTQHPPPLKRFFPGQSPGAPRIVFSPFRLAQTSPRELPFPHPRQLQFSQLLPFLLLAPPPLGLSPALLFCESSFPVKNKRKSIP